MCGGGVPSFLGRQLVLLVEPLQGRRGQFYQPQTHLNLPVYLEAEVEAYLAARAKAKDIDVGQLVNELLKKAIELIEAAR